VRHAGSRFANSIQIDSCSRHFAGVRRVSPSLLAAVAATALSVALALAFTAQLAEARLVNPEQTAAFGPDGTSATTFPNINRIALDQSGKRLYALGYGPPRIFGLDVTTPGSYSAVGGKFPIEVTNSSGEAAGIAVDNSGQPSHGNIYYASGANSNNGFTSDGTPLVGWDPLYSGGCGAGVDPSGSVFLGAYNERIIEKRTASGELLGTIDTSPLSPCIVDFDSNGDMYYGGHKEGEATFVYGPLYRRTIASGYSTAEQIDPDPTFSVVVDRTHHTIYTVHSNRANEYDSSGNLLQQFATGVNGANFKGIAVDESTGTVFISNSGSGQILEYPQVAAPDVTTGTVSDVTTTSAVVTGHIDPAGGGDIVSCRVEYGRTATYGQSAPCEPQTPYSGPQDVAAHLTDLRPGVEYHFRVVAGNEKASSVGFDGPVFQTPGPPTIELLHASNLTASSADLTTSINPHGAATSYHFIYGQTASYGSTAPESDAPVGDDSLPHRLTIHLSGLEPTTYHFAVVAHNEHGTAISGDSTFTFYPPNCPNEHLRQQSGASFLPDCRSYELVTPENIGSAILFPAGPISGTATSPSRLSFGGGIGGIPGSGDPQTGGSIDTYVATRTTNGWVTKYVGLSGNKGFSHGGPPTEGSPGQPRGLQADSSLSTFVDWNTGAAKAGVHELGSLAGYRWNSEGRFLGRLPTNVEEIHNGTADIYDGGFVGTARLSKDGTHYAFSSANVAFTPDGLTTGSGSVYDNDIQTGTVKKISVLADGSDLPHEPGAQTPDFLNIPAVSNDGSHVLIEAPIHGACGRTSPCAQLPFTCSESYEEQFALNGCPTNLPSHLYMRVNDAVTYDVSEGHVVKYFGMTSDGSKIFVSSDERLTADDHDSSADLYVWDENTTPHYTRISTGEGGTGDTDQCAAKWISGCGAEFVKTKLFPGTGLLGFIPLVQTPSDDTISSQSGDVLFYSPELLESGNGIPGARNLYLFRNGQVHLVASLREPSVIQRMQISPDGSHIAFATDEQLTGYDNGAADGTCETGGNGIAHTGPRCVEMYGYESDTGRIFCASCRPDGLPPSEDVEASHGGRFMTDDGRIFFSTLESLVPSDADGLRDTYEFVDNRPQLISSGTNTTDTNGFENAGLVGVSDDGTDAYFSTSSTFVGQDKVGLFFKIYDARTGGGFPYEPPEAPCAAADECHGSTAGTPPAIVGSTTEPLGDGGNLRPRPHRKRKKRSRKGTSGHAVDGGRGKRRGDGRKRGDGHKSGRSHG
jgi:hypothetical protein